LNHASIVTAAASRAQAVYHHCDLNHLETSSSGGRENRWIVTETVLHGRRRWGIVELASRHGAFVIVDEAHATVFWDGPGRVEVRTTDSVDVQVATSEGARVRGRM
jgi:7-keto-8-aminopelargonate synthetase-like enzyme